MNQTHTTVFYQQISVLKIVPKNLKAGGNLLIHERVHTGETHFLSPQCGNFQFSTRFNKIELAFIRSFFSIRFQVNRPRVWPNMNLSCCAAGSYSFISLGRSTSCLQYLRQKLRHQKSLANIQTIPWWKEMAMPAFNSVFFFSYRLDLTHKSHFIDGRQCIGIHLI